VSVTEKKDRRLAVVVACSIVLTVALVAAGLRLERNLEDLEEQVLQRAPSAAPLETLESRLEKVAVGRTVFVPVYSHVFRYGGEQLLLEVTLTVRNTDTELPIVVESVRYYGTAGELLREYLDAPVVLGPLASADFLVEQRDRAGGVGANFLVEWVAESPVIEPLIEAVMVGSEGDQAISFARPGHAID
jgi:hypothetical protein